MRTALIYLVLVGLPTLGVLGVLRAGADLEAPSGVGGTWEIVASDGCALRPGHRLVLVQSGEYVMATWPGGATSRGRLIGRQFEVEPGARGRVVPGCAGEPVGISVGLPPGNVRPDTLRGTAAVPGAEAIGRAFTAARAPVARAAAGQL